MYMKDASLFVAEGKAIMENTEITGPEIMKNAGCSASLPRSSAMGRVSHISGCMLCSTGCRRAAALL